MSLCSDYVVYVLKTFFFFFEEACILFLIQTLNPETLIIFVELWNRKGKKKKQEKKKKSFCSFLDNIYLGKINEFNHGWRNVCQRTGNGVTVILCSAVFPNFSLSLQFIRDDISGVLLTWSGGESWDLWATEDILSSLKVFRERLSLKTLAVWALSKHAHQFWTLPYTTEENTIQRVPQDA